MDDGLLQEGVEAGMQTIYENGILTLRPTEHVDAVNAPVFEKDIWESLEKYKADDRFVFLEQEKHINGAEARNCGIRNARGDYIAFLDDDDTLAFMRSWIRPVLQN